ncbi:MAG: diacylglycerol kinase family protein [Clostridia bacterium]|nr:diacylglycerol kinase family protein [Clostridia bacterium]
MKKQSLLQSFRHAFCGIRLSLRERNMRIHFACAVIAISMSVILNLRTSHKAIIIILCALVISAELINTAIENAVDLSCGVFNMYAKRAKDASAGAVLALSIGAVICGAIIFIPYLLELLHKII